MGKSKGISWVMGVGAVLALSACGGGGSGSPVPPPATGSSSVQPAPPVLSSNGAKLVAGDGHNLYLKSDGSVWGWGYDERGQVGNGTSSRVLVSVPAQVAGASGFIDVAAGGFSSAALRADGTVWAWGGNDTGSTGKGYLGTASTDLCSDGFNSLPCAKAPIRIKELQGVTGISAGTNSMAAVRNDGTVWTWGNLASTTGFSPLQVAGLADIKSVAVGDEFGLALRKDGTVWGWGDDISRNLGIPAGGLTAMQVPGLSDVVAMSTGVLESYVLTKSGRVIHLDARNSIGAPVTSDMNLSGITAIASGYSNAMALTADGTVWVWGGNSYGQLGNGTTVASKVPVQVAGLSGVVAIAVGHSSLLALTQDGTVWTWGGVDPKNVESSVLCDEAFFDTHGPGLTLSALSVTSPCAKTPVKVVFR